MRPILSHISNHRYTAIFLASLIDLILGSLYSQCGAKDLVLMRERCNDVDIQQNGTALKIITTGHDPYLVWQVASPPTEDESVLSFEYFSLINIDSIHGYHGPPIEENSRFELPNISISEGWSEYRYDLRTEESFRQNDAIKYIRLDPGMAADKSFQLRRPKLTQPSPAELIAAETLQIKNAHKKAQSERLNDYLQFDFPARISNIHVDNESISLEIVVNGKTLNDPIQLIEFPLWQSPNDRGLDCQKHVSPTNQTIQLPRFIDGRDRSESGWRLESTTHPGEFLTARHFASRLVEIDANEEKVNQLPKSKKGLSGVSQRGPMQDLLDLKITAITINLVLNQFISIQSEPNLVAIPDTDPTLYFDPRPFETYDRIIEFAKEHDIVVSAIVLITSNASRKTSPPLVHPEATGGIYAMPDLSSESGCNLYRFILNVIAERYGKTNQHQATITNWIAHNEIDYHHVWTNMGKQPENIVTEIYYRSMRLIEAVACHHNPYARVFASYTHHWNTPAEEDWTRLCTRRSLLQLQKLSLLEGDFRWGIAYHPYPENLFAPKAWEGKEVLFSLDTPMITMQNLEVLGRFVRSPEMEKANGQRRPVILSEQGFHTPSYDRHYQTLQAASIWYAMQKIDSCDWIESFYYHRWIDHPEEGGLQLGLRTLPTPNQPYGEKKQAWYMYRAIGTKDVMKEVDKLPQELR